MGFQRPRVQGADFANLGAKRGLPWRLGGQPKVLQPGLNLVVLEDAALAAAKALLAMADGDGSVSQLYVLQVTGGVQGVVQGDHANVTMNFGGDPLQKG